MNIPQTLEERQEVQLPIRMHDGLNGEQFSFERKFTKSVEKNDNRMECRDSHCRSILKAVSWRVAGSVTTMSIAWAVTSEIKIATAIGVGDALVKLGLFYAHERAWDRITFGRRRPPDYEI
ncbi:MAG: DUF2061 domain-containing protein [Planctomycetota bacterium]